MIIPKQEDTPFKLPPEKKWNKDIGELLHLVETEEGYKYVDIWTYIILEEDPRVFAA